MKDGDDDDRLFSYRTGIRQDKKMQVESMDLDLRNCIWNAVYKFCLEKEYHYIEDSSNGTFVDPPVCRSDIISTIFDRFFREDASVSHSVDEVKDKFYDLEWDEVYSFVEFTLKRFPLTKSGFRNRLNRVLEEESAGYRIMSNKITPITNDLEMSEVETAQHTSTAEINEHVKSAIALLSDRGNPDPRNAAKEAISAVEALCKKITGDNEATLGQALSKIQSGDPKPFDPHLEAAIRNLYKFSNSSSGVRHAHAEGKTQVGFDEAKFMVVACSAIVNYLVKHAASE